MHSKNKYYFLSNFICFRQPKRKRKRYYEIKPNKYKKVAFTKKAKKATVSTKAKLVAIKNALSFVLFYYFIFEEHED